jgi:glycosyltransferase involved in cell wall biosynthesis
VASPLAVEGLEINLHDPQGPPHAVADSDADLAAAIASLLADPERRAALAGRAHAWAAAHLGWRRPAAAFARLYAELRAAGGPV